MSFQSLLRLLTDGTDKVDAGTLNRILRVLDGNIKFVKAVLDAAAYDSTLYAREAVVESGALVGHAVYFDSVSQTFKRALANTLTDGGGNLLLASSGQVWGVVHTKYSSTVADILLAGYTALDISNAVGSPTAGIYYLSSTTPGHMTHTIPSPTVTVLQHDGNGHVLVRPFYRDALDTFATVDTVVTSLVSLSDRLIITCATNNSPASTGPLQIDLDLQFEASDSSTDGFEVFKTYTDNQFHRGPVVEGLIAGSNITLTASHTNSNPAIGKQGRVRIDAALAISGSELLPEWVRLNNATDEFYQGVTAIGFEEGKTSSIRVMLHIPATVTAGSLMKVKLIILGRAAGTAPTLTLTKRILSEPTAVLTNLVALPTSDVSVTLNTTATLPGADYYYEALSASFTVNPGDVVFYTLARASSEAGPDVLLLHQCGVLV